MALAAAGVAARVAQGRSCPGLAWRSRSRSAYGLLRKTAALGAIEGLTLETLMLAPLALGMLAWWSWQGTGGLAGHDAARLAWLVGVGPLTAVPLLLFAAGARRIPMATLGLLQYVSPTLQLLLGVLLFGEPLAGARLAGFALIWLALAVYSVEGLAEFAAGRGRPAGRLNSRPPRGRTAALAEIPARLASVSGAITMCAG